MSGQSSPPRPTVLPSGPFRLHVGGKEPKEGWRILNIQPGPHVDYTGDCSDLGQFLDACCDEIYASHVLEHLSYKRALGDALRGFHRILKPGGILRVSVPDLEILCRLLVRPDLTMPQRFYVMQMMFGGQGDANDFHHTGLTWEFLSIWLREVGFQSVRRVRRFGLFNDNSEAAPFGDPVSLNVEAVR